MNDEIRMTKTLPTYVLYSFVLRHLDFVIS